MLIVLLIPLLIASIIQVIGAHLEERPCKYIKYSYSLSLLLSAIVLFVSFYSDCMYLGFTATLLLLTTNIILGGVVRLYTLLKHKRECPIL